MASIIRNANRKAEGGREEERPQKICCVDKQLSDFVVEVDQNIVFSKAATIDHNIKVRYTEESFKAKYKEFSKIGNGCSGVVYAGERLSDSKPVAIKHIPRCKVEYAKVYWNNRSYVMVVEVLLMAQAAGRLYRDGVKNDGVIDLLDVYHLKDEVRIVMERPLECFTVQEFFYHRKGKVPEHEVKNVIKQLVDTAELIHRNGVYHQDIGRDNILLSQHEGDFSLRIIDFGEGDLVEDHPCRAEPTTVFQIGNVVREIFDDETESHLSEECKDFINQCLSFPEDRPTLDQLQLHPWLQ